MADPRRNPNDGVNKVTEVVRRGADAAQDATRTGLDSMSEGARRMADQFGEAFGFSGQQGEEIARQATENLTAIAETGSVLVRGFQELSREWLDLAQSGLQRNMENLNALSRCRSWQDFVAVQSGLVRENLQDVMDGTRRIAERSVQVANDAVHTLAAQAEPGRRAA
jgi:phasin family protein